MTLFLSIALLITILICFWLRRSEQKVRERSAIALAELEKSVEEEAQAYQDETERVRQHYQAEAERIYTEMKAALTDAQEQLKRFEALQALGENEAEVRAVLAAALEEAEKLKAEAAKMFDRTKEQSAAERSAALQKARDIRDQAEAFLSRATLRESELVAEAHRKAEEIGGDAYRALREKEHLGEAIKAIRNVIDGYGDQYVRPTRSLLDDLAADFGHTEAGVALATVRERVRTMVDNGLAAECDYAEAKRRGTAIRFVVDAFNGRVDTILSRVKHDNAGTLEQEIRDAYNLVNLNGEAFRNARIKPEFLDARLTELKWAVVVQELKIQEREEQRRIREQIREEERSRREYEKAIREAQKEEIIIKNALEKARHEAEAASEEQRLQFEQKVADLSRKLNDAEAKNQRALSMAQQTRKGNVYIISNVGSFGEEVFKIGLTRRLEPLDRVKELGDASVPFDFDVHAIIPSDDAPTLEGKLHAAFNELRLNQVNRRKEFFRVPLNRVREFIKEHRIEASFTMTAEAHDFRESQAIIKMNASERADIEHNALSAKVPLTDEESLTSTSDEE